MPSGGDKLVTLIIDAKNMASGELQRLQGDMKGVGSAAKAQGVIMGVAASVTSSALGMVASAAQGSVQFLEDGVQKASDLRETLALTDQVFGSASQSVRSWAEANAVAMGETRNEALRTADGFGNLFTGAGLAMDQSAQMAETLSKRVVDLGSAFNASSAEVAEAVQSGLTGQVEPLRRFGVFLSEAAVGQKALAMGMRPVAGAFTDSQKVLARYQLVLDQTTASAGMFGRDAGSLADKSKMLTAKVDELQTHIGEGLTPTLNLAADGLLRLSSVADGTSKSVGDDLGTAVWDIGKALRSLDPMTSASDRAWEKLTASTTAAAAGATEASRAWQGALEDMAKSGSLAESRSRVAAQMRQVGNAAGTAYTQGFIFNNTLNRELAANARQGVLDAAAAVRSARQAYIDAWRQTLDDRNQVANDKDQLIINRAEIVAQRQILADRKATASQKAEARIRIRQLQEDDAIIEKELARIAADAKGYGTSLVHNYAVGMLLGKHEVVTASGEVATVVASHFRIKSPAKEGPLSEGGGPEGYGRAFALKWGAGLRSGAPDVAGASSDLASSALGGGPAGGPRPVGLAGGAAGAGGGYAGGGVHLHVSTVVAPSRAQIAEMADALDAEFRRRYPRFSPYAARP